MKSKIDYICLSLFLISLDRKGLSEVTQLILTCFTSTMKTHEKCEKFKGNYKDTRTTSPENISKLNITVTFFKALDSIWKVCDPLTIKGTPVSPNEGCWRRSILPWCLVTLLRPKYSYFADKKNLFLMKFWIIIVMKILNHYSPSSLTLIRPKGYRCSNCYMVSWHRKRYIL